MMNTATSKMDMIAELGDLWRTVCTVAQPDLTSLNILLQEIYMIRLFFNDRIDDVTDAKHPDHFLIIHYRKVTDTFVDEKIHAIFHVHLR